MDEPVRVLYVAPDSASETLPTGALGVPRDRVVVETANSVREGLDLLETAAFDCVVGHADLPEVDGMEFLEAVRADHEALPVVMVTGDGGEAVVSDPVGPLISRYGNQAGGTDRRRVVPTRRGNDDGRRLGPLGGAHRRRLQAISENVPDGIVTIDTDSVIRSANPGMADLFGYPADALVGRPLTDLMPARFEERHLAAVAAYLERGERSFDWKDTELPGQHRDGSEIPLSVSFSEFERDGERFFTGIMRDITERKEYEARLERQNERLDQFASVVSHDLRNPLNVAELRLELALAECDSEHLESVADAHDRMSRLIEELLAYARAGQEAIQPEPVDLSALATRCWNEIETADATLTAAVDRKIRADPGRLRQLLENLFDNAVTHGGDDVTVTVETVDGGFAVADDGVGISEGEREAAFDPGHSTADEGMGFGLAIVEDVAAAHGWEVAVSEGDAGGSRFEITGVDFAA